MDRRSFLRGAIPVGAAVVGTGALSPRAALASGLAKPIVPDLVSDGRTDNRRAIQAALDRAVAAGGGTVRLPAGTFLIGGQLTIKGDGVTLVGAGPASILKVADGALSDAAGNRHAVHVRGSHFRLANMTIDGNEARQTVAPNLDLVQLGDESQNGNDGLAEGPRYVDLVVERCALINAVTRHLRVHKARHVRIRNNTMSGISADHSQNVGNIKLRWVWDFLVEGNQCDFAGNPRPSSTNIHISHSGNSNSGSERGIVRSNVVSDSTDSPIEASSSTAGSRLDAVVREVVITENIVKNGAGIISLQSRDVIIANNTIIEPGARGGNSWGIRLGCSSNSDPRVLQQGVVVRGNLIRGASAATSRGILIDGAGGRCREITIADNLISDVPRGSGVVIDGRMLPPPNHVTGVMVHGNQLTNVGSAVTLLGLVPEAVVTDRHNAVA